MRALITPSTRELLIAVAVNFIVWLPFLLMWGLIFLNAIAQGPD